MSEDVNHFIKGTMINSHTSPITYRAAQRHSEATNALNEGSEISIAQLVAHFDASVLRLYNTIAEVETGGKYIVDDQTN